jgi:rhomboid family GlyGly-CTERM serine protease
VGSIRHYNLAIVRLHTHLPALAVAAGSLALLLLWPALQYQHQTGWLGRAGSALWGQFAHMDAEHWLLNCIGLLLLSWGFEPWRSRKLDCLFFASGLAGVWAGLMLSDHIVWYKGLSGALHGLFTAYCIHVLTSERRTGSRWVAGVLILGLLSKLLLETRWAELRVVPAGVTAQPVLYEAHQWGAVAGLLAGFAQAAASAAAARRQSKPTAPMANP